MPRYFCTLQILSRCSLSTGIKTYFGDNCILFDQWEDFRCLGYSSFRFVCLKQLNNNEQECVDFEARFCCSISETDPQLSRHKLHKLVTSKKSARITTTTETKIISHFNLTTTPQLITTPITGAILSSLDSKTVNATTLSTLTTTTTTTIILPNNVTEPAKPLSYESLDYANLTSEDLRQFIQVGVIIEIWNVLFLSGAEIFFIFDDMRLFKA